MALSPELKAAYTFYKRRIKDIEDIFWPCTYGYVPHLSLFVGDFLYAWDDNNKSAGFFRELMWAPSHHKKSHKKYHEAFTLARDLILGEDIYEDCYDFDLQDRLDHDIIEDSERPTLQYLFDKTPKMLPVLTATKQPLEHVIERRYRSFIIDFDTNQDSAACIAQLRQDDGVDSADIDRIADCVNALSYDIFNLTPAEIQMIIQLHTAVVSGTLSITAPMSVLD